MIWKSLQDIFFLVSGFLFLVAGWGAFGQLLWPQLIASFCTGVQWGKEGGGRWRVLCLPSGGVAADWRVAHGIGR